MTTWRSVRQNAIMGTVVVTANWLVLPIKLYFISKCSRIYSCMFYFNYQRRKKAINILLFSARSNQALKKLYEEMKGIENADFVYGNVALCKSLKRMEKVSRENTNEIWIKFSNCRRMKMAFGKTHTKCQIHIGVHQFDVRLCTVNYVQHTDWEMLHASEQLHLVLSISMGNCLGE